MATTLVANGQVLAYVAGSAISSGDVVVTGDLVGIALEDIASGATGSVAIEGVYTVAKTTGTAWAQGDSLDWDASASEFHINVTPASGDCENCGNAYVAAASGAATGQIRLTPGTGTTT